MKMVCFALSFATCVYNERNHLHFPKDLKLLRVCYGELGHYLRQVRGVTRQYLGPISQKKRHWKVEDIQYIVIWDKKVPEFYHQMKLKFTIRVYHLGKWMKYFEK